MVISCDGKNCLISIYQQENMNLVTELPSESLSVSGTLVILHICSNQDMRNYVCKTINESIRHGVHVRVQINTKGSRP